jgi:hypothetical protein
MDDNDDELAQVGEWLGLFTRMQRDMKLDPALFGGFIQAVVAKMAEGPRAVIEEEAGEKLDPSVHPPSPNPRRWYRPGQGPAQNSFIEDEPPAQEQAGLLALADGPSSGGSPRGADYRHPPAKKLQAPPSWMFKGQNQLNRAHGAHGGETDVEAGGSSAKRKFRKAFLHNSFLLLKKRLSRTFSFIDGPDGPPKIRCSYCQKKQWRAKALPVKKKAKKEKKEKKKAEEDDDEDDDDEYEESSSEEEEEEEGGKEEDSKEPGWTQREVLNDFSASHYVEEVVLCPRHEQVRKLEPKFGPKYSASIYTKLNGGPQACCERMVDADASTVLLKTMLWLELAAADRRRFFLLRIFC